MQHSKGWAQAKKHDENKRHGVHENKRHDGHGTGPNKKKSTKTIKIVTPRGGAKHHTQQES